MLAFYWDTLRRSPIILWESIKTVNGELSIALFLLLLFNKELSISLMNWEGISPLWSLVPVGLLFAHAMLRGVYAKHALLESCYQELVQQTKPVFDILISVEWNEEGFCAKLVLQNRGLKTCDEASLRIEVIRPSSVTAKRWGRYDNTMGSFERLYLSAERTGVWPIAHKHSIHANGNAVFSFAEAWSKRGEIRINHNHWATWVDQKGRERSRHSPDGLSRQWGTYEITVIAEARDRPPLRKRFIVSTRRGKVKIWSLPHETRKQQVAVAA